MQKIRVDRIRAELNQLNQESNLSVIPCEPDDLIREDLWIIWVQGKKGSIHQHAKYPVRIEFPEKYPTKPPKVSFEKDFLHIHVYEGGTICLPILDEVNWKPKFQMTEVIRRIQALIHQQINPYSPANSTLFNIYLKDGQKYKEMMSKQVEVYKQKNPKYYQQPSIHIEIINQDSDT